MIVYNINKSTLRIKTWFDNMSYLKPSITLRVAYFIMITSLILYILIQILLSNIALINRAGGRI